MAEAALRNMAPLHSPVSGSYTFFGSSQVTVPAPVETVVDEELVIVELPDPDVELVDVPD